MLNMSVSFAQKIVSDINVEVTISPVLDKNLRKLKKFKAFTFKIILSDYLLEK